MSFSIKCNKCGSVVEELKEYKDYETEYSDNEKLTDQNETITVSSLWGYHGTSSLLIVCKCGNEA